MSFRSIVLTSVMLAAAAPLAAQEPAPTPTPSATPAPAVVKVKKPRTVCRLEESVGSNFQKRVCRSAEEWAAIDHAQPGAPRFNGSSDSGH